MNTTAGAARKEKAPAGDVYKRQAYDSDGSITSITDIDGYKVSFTYTANTRGKQVASVQEYGCLLYTSRCV